MSPKRASLGEPVHHLNWSHMEVLLVICEQGAISAAAKALHVDQSTLSRRLTAMEQQVGQKLFARSKSGAHPTELALALLPMAKTMRRTMHQARAVAGGFDERPQGVVRLAVTEVVAQFFLAPHLGAFLTEHPGVRLEITTGARVADMNQLEADLVVRLMRPKSGELHVKRLMGSTLSILGHGDYLRERADAPVEALDWIGWTHPFDALFESKWLAQRGIEPRVRFNRILPILEAVRQGVGVAVLGAGFASLFEELGERKHPSLAQAHGAFWLVRPHVHVGNPLIDLVVRWLEHVFSEASRRVMR